MTVAVDGVERYRWPVSSGLPSYETPNGSFRTFRMEEDHYSKEFDEAPMPHSIFFTKIGPRHPRHRFRQPSRLARRRMAACGCRATTPRRCLRWCKEHGVLNTTVTLTGSSQVALARNPRPRANTAVARRAPLPQYEPQYNSAGDPVVITPQPQRVAPQARADDGYIYPADGSSNEARYPAPRSRRVYGAQAYPQPQQQYYDDRGYAPAPQGYTTSRGSIISRAGCSPIRTNGRMRSHPAARHLSRPWRSRAAVALRRQPRCCQASCSDHPCRHRHDEDDDAGRQRRQALQRRPRAQSDEAPSDSEQRGARDQRRIDPRFARPEILRGKPRLRARDRPA